MATRLDIVIVALLCALPAVALAHFPELLPFPGWWSEGERDPRGADVQVVYLPALLPREAQLAADRPDDVPLPYSFDAFGRSFQLQLVPNRRLVARAFGVWSERGHDAPLSAVDTSCHFQHTGPGAVAAFSACKDHALHGLIVVDNSTYEVRPLAVGVGRAEDDGRTAHMIRRAPPPPAPRDDARPLRPRPRRTRTPRARYPYLKPGPPSYTIEIALFLDEAAYKIFHPYFNYKETDLRDMLLAYINGVQALYQHWSLGTQIQLSLVRMTLLRAQPQALPAHAERGRLLDSFCAYQRSLNVEDDNDPEHWDMALLLSGLDFYSEEGGRRNGVTMGLAPVGGVCLPAHACVVAEFGAQDVLGRPYPSAGFTSVYILAHEIGHNLGMHHDGTGNACARDGYIMSPSRGTSGEATWSPCSAQVVADLQWATCLLDGGSDALDTPDALRHERFGGAPGLVWGAKKQCEILLRDVDAAPSPPAPQATHCAQLACRTPHRAGFYYAGPALPGTPCGRHKWCQGGECVASGGADTTTPFTPSVTSSDNNNGNSGNVGSPSHGNANQGSNGGNGGNGSNGSNGGNGGNGNNGSNGSHGSNSDHSEDGWGAWREGSCRSGCTLRSRGFRERRRACSAAAGCHGVAYDVVVCDDGKVCGKKTRVSVGELATRKCAEYAARVPDLDPRGGGLQAPHDPTRMWMGCAVFCRRAAGGGFYAPRVELNDVGLDPYFPDGTWCHHDGSQDYYCLQHHCLPENFKMTAQFHIWELPSEDVGGPFNARALSSPEDPALRRYHSLSEDGVPITRSAFPPQITEEPENHWEVVDYIDLLTKNDTADAVD